MFRVQAAFPVLACGGRDYQNYTRVREILDRLHTIRKIDVLMTGAARGADELAIQWARERYVPYIGVPADWEAYGDRAGPIRNGFMLDIVTPKCVVAFPGGRGTAHMVSIAKRVKGCYVMEVTDEGIPAALLRRESRDR